MAARPRPAPPHRRRAARRRRARGPAGRRRHPLRQHRGRPDDLRLRLHPDGRQRPEPHRAARVVLAPGPPAVEPRGRRRARRAAVHRDLRRRAAPVAVHRRNDPRRRRDLRRRGQPRRHGDDGAPARHAHVVRRADGARPHAAPGVVRDPPRVPAPAPDRGRRGRHRRRRPHPTHPGAQQRRRGREPVALAQRHARPHRELVRRARGLRGEDAAVRRRRQPRAAHPWRPSRATPSCTGRARCPGRSD